MHAVTHDRFGDPAEVLQTTPTDRPVPQEGELLIRVILSPIHNHDLWTIRGSYGTKPPLPAIAGSEAVGIVEATGPGVDPALQGRRVAVAGLKGSWAEYAIAAAEGAIPVPDEMPDEAAAQLIAMPFSAITLLEFLHVERGDWVIQTAANGAVGKIMAVLAQSRGIRLLNLVRRPEAAEELAALGMTDIVSTNDPDWIAKAHAILGEDGARAAVDSVGGPIAAGLVDLLGTEGLLVTFGSMTGDDLQLPAGPIIFKHLTVKGFWGARVMPQTPAEDRQRMFGELIGLVMDGALKLPSGGTFGLDQPAEAVTAALTPGREGKIMFRP
ncbi:zinc-binding dehydrogenase [Paracoccus liaowanqingii]|uniref:enoyl-[acyl-carrier-protein] reductase n=1 Tax=Paracoccus liaowanqingii TaxID=2560053 RepID=A0A4P7HMG0_9RHOB|nr:zinc-binding dehydrogenase [Paracoccus liaowanqingii]QBX34853.1 zinc-binding dehydrogenase [Paracoccus liaowanqingii]